MLVFKDQKIGEIDRDIQIESKEDNAQASIMMTEQCTYALDIVSPDLDPFVYDHLQFVNALKNLALRGRRTAIRILLNDVNGIVKRGHRVIEVASQLSSFIELRKLSNDHADFNEALLIADKIAFIYRNNATRYEAKVNFNDRRQCRHLEHAFEQMWQTAKPDPNLRRITI